MADHLKLKNGTVRYVGAGEDVIGVVWMSDAVVYGSFRDEQAFPPILGLAMSLGRPVIAPNRRAFREQVRSEYMVEKIRWNTGFRFVLLLF